MGTARVAAVSKQLLKGGKQLTPPNGERDDDKRNTIACSSCWKLLNQTIGFTEASPSSSAIVVVLVMERQCPWRKLIDERGASSSSSFSTALLYLCLAINWQRECQCK